MSKLHELAAGSALAAASVLAAAETVHAQEDQGTVAGDIATQNPDGTTNMHGVTPEATTTTLPAEQIAGDIATQNPDGTTNITGVEVVAETPIAPTESTSASTSKVTIVSAPEGIAPITVTAETTAPSTTTTEQATQEMQPAATSTTPEDKSGKTSPAAPLALGGAAVGIALAGRRILATRK